MRLADIQPAIQALLAESTELTGVAVVVDDGSYPKIPAIDEALAIDTADEPGAKRGLCLIVYRPEHGEMIGATDDVFADTVLCSVIIEEVATVNRGSYGTGITVEDAIERVMRAVLSKRNDDPTVTVKVFQPADPPWSPTVVVNGRRKAVVDFLTQHEVSLQ